MPRDETLNQGQSDGGAMGFVGADSAELESLTTSLLAGGESLRRMVRRINALLASPSWSGQDSDDFRHEWSNGYRVALLGAASRLDLAAGVLKHNAEEQSRASRDDQGLTHPDTGIAGILSAFGRFLNGWAGPRDPKQAAAWWASLSDQERATLLREEPERLGKLDGLPGAVRDKANRRVIDEELERLRAEYDELDLKLPESMIGAVGYAITRQFTNEDRKEEILRAKIRALVVLQGLGPGRQILLVDTAGERVKAAVAVGDVDKAANIAVTVHGFTSNVEGGLAGKLADASYLRTQCAQIDGRYDQTAVVVWMGYEAPQWKDTLNPGDSVASSAAAEDAAPDLNRFLVGLDENRSGDVRVVAIGHSYGSLVTGLALAGSDHPVDAVIFQGSPGIGVDSISDLGMDKGSVFVAEADRDPVADLARFSKDPNSMDGVIVLETDAVQGHIGASGHSQYSENDSTSQYGTALIATGQTEGVIVADGQNAGIGDLLRSSAERINLATPIIRP